MPALTKKKKYTPEEYLALEEKAEFRSEYDNGEIVAMSGGSFNHAQIIANLGRNIGNKISSDCSALTSDMKVRVENYRKFYYPDVLIICGRPAFYETRNDTITNPVLIVEVLSDSTEAKDRGEKLLAYRTLESLQEYVLVSQSRPIVEQYTKTADVSWIHRARIGLRSAVRFESVDIELNLEDIYQRVEFEEENL